MVWTPYYWVVHIPLYSSARRDFHKLKLVQWSIYTSTTIQASGFSVWSDGGNASQPQVHTIKYVFMWAEVRTMERGRHQYRSALRPSSKVPVNNRSFDRIEPRRITLYAQFAFQFLWLACALGIVMRRYVILVKPVLQAGAVREHWHPSTFFHSHKHGPFKTSMVLYGVIQASRFVCGSCLFEQPITVTIKRSTT